MANILLIALSVAYPFAVYFSLQHWQPKYLVFVLVPVLLLRVKSTAAVLAYEKWLLLGIVVALMLYTWFSNHALGVKLYPVYMNAFMLAVFSYSLFKPPSMIERLARLREPNLPHQAVAYTRKVTVVWVIFFMFNLLLALLTTLFCSDKIWVLYNGFIAYVLMGLLFVIEYIVRMRVRKNHVA